MRTRINTLGGSVGYDIPVIKSQRYSIDEILEKNLLFLIPFYIFSHESRFKKYESDTAMLETLMSEYECIRERLEKLAEQKTINEFTKCTILDNLEDGKSEEAIVNKLVRRFRLETEDAKAYFDKYAKESV